MTDKNSAYPKKETGFAFKRHVNVVYVKSLNDQILNQDSDEYAILKIKFYNPPDLIFQHLPVEDNVKNIEVNRMRNGFITDTLTSVGIQEIVKIVGKVIEIYEGVFCRENSKVSPFRKGMRKLFFLPQKYKYERNDLRQSFVELIMKSLYGVQIRKDFNESFKSSSQNWMQTEYDDNILDYWRLKKREFFCEI